MNQQNNFENNNEREQSLEKTDNQNTENILFEQNAGENTELKSEKNDGLIGDATDAPTNKKRKKLGKPQKILLTVLIVILVLLLSGILTVYILIETGRKSLLNTDNMSMDLSSTISDAKVEDDGKTIINNGKRYVYNENMTTVLFIGVDQEDFSDIAGVNGLNGQADAIFLCAMDTLTGKSSIIPVSRDTMVDIDLYSKNGQYVSSSKKQLCLAYAYGDGKHTSCENTVKSVSRIFYGLPINSYVAIDLEAIEILTDKVGGVTLTPQVDFNYGSDVFAAGKEVTLKGNAARSFVQSRDIDKLSSNEDRMARQKQFMTAFFKSAFAKTKENITFPVDVYSSVSKYMITDIDIAEISFFASCVLKGGGSLTYKSIEGETVMGEKHAEHYVKDDSVYNTILDVFYKPVD